MSDDLPDLLDAGISDNLVELKNQVRRLKRSTNAARKHVRRLVDGIRHKNAQVLEGRVRSAERYLAAFHRNSEAK